MAQRWVHEDRVDGWDERAHEWARWHNWVRGLHEGPVGQDGTAGVGRQAS